MVSFLYKIRAYLLRNLLFNFTHENYGRIYLVNPMLVDKWCELPTYSLLRWQFFYTGKWDLILKDLMERPDFKFTYSRFVDGVNWDKTGSFEFMKSYIQKNGSFDGWDESDESIARRHHDLDVMYESVKSEERFKFVFEINPIQYSYVDSVLCAMTRDGSLVFAGAGQHRLAIARILQIKSLPICLAAVHAERKNDWFKYLSYYTVN